MITKLIPHGDGWALVLDRPTLDSLGLSPEEAVELTTVGNTLKVIRVTRDTHQHDVQSARAKINAQYHDAFQKLAE